MDIFIDFETRSRVDLAKCGVNAYADHASTVLLCMAFAIDDGSVQLWVPGQPFPAALIDAANSNASFYAHNAAFERAIWNRQTRQHGWPELPLTRWVCTAAKAAAAGLPRSLDGAAKALALATEKDSEGHKLMLKYCKPRKPTTTNPDEWCDDPRELDAIYEYCKTDVEVERLIAESTPPLHERELLTYWLDQLINDRGVPIDVETVRRFVGQLKSYSAELNDEIKALTGYAGTQVAKLVEWLAARGVNIDSLNKEVVTSLLESDELTGDARRVVEIRQQLSRSSTAKFNAMLSRTSGDGRARGVHLYYGAATGRWSGRGIQTQNLPRGIVKHTEIEGAITATLQGGIQSLELLYGDATEALASLIRPMIKAGDGKKLIGCDFAAIECRVLAWLADERGLLDDFRNHRDAYKSLASRIYRVAYDDVTKDQRQMGKQAILGLGYGMGWGTFQETCRKYRIEIDDNFAQSVVTLYRETYQSINDFWQSCQHGAIAATKNGQCRISRQLQYIYDGRWLRCELPSGRSIWYYDPKVTKRKTPWGKMVDELSYMQVDSVTKQWVRRKSYGGLLVENIVQGVARDLLVDAMFRAERAGYPVVLHVHDEIVCEVGDATADLSAVESLMSEVPKWASGCPIEAEGFIGERYRK